MHKLPYNPNQAQINPDPAIHQNGDHPFMKHELVGPRCAALRGAQS